MSEETKAGVGKTTLIAELVICVMMWLYIFIPGFLLVSHVVEITKNIFTFSRYGLFVPTADPLSIGDSMENALRGRGVSLHDFKVLYFMVLFPLCMYSQSVRRVFGKNIIFNLAMMALFVASLFVEHSDHAFFALFIKSVFAVPPFSAWLTMAALFCWIASRYDYLDKFMDCFVSKEATHLNINRKQLALDVRCLVMLIVASHVAKFTG